MSTARRAKAQETRRGICAAAKELFLARGYAATTIAEIAKAAGVAHQTVYFIFGSKAALLAAIMDLEIVGDSEPVSLLERPQVKSLPAITPAARRLEHIVHVAADVTERLAPLYEIVRSGAAEGEVGELLDRHEEQRWHSLRAMVAELEGSLADGVSIEDAADRLYVLLSHETYWLLVHRRGWAHERWRHFATTESAHQLL